MIPRCYLNFENSDNSAKAKRKHDQEVLSKSSGKGKIKTELKENTAITYAPTNNAAIPAS